MANSIGKLCLKQALHDNLVNMTVNVFVSRLKLRIWERKFRMTKDVNLLASEKEAKKTLNYFVERRKLFT